MRRTMPRLQYAPPSDSTIPVSDGESFKTVRRPRSHPAERVPGEIQPSGVHLAVPIALRATPRSWRYFTWPGNKAASVSKRASALRRQFDRFVGRRPASIDSVLKFTPTRPAM